MRVLRKKERNKGQKNWKAKLSMLMVLCLVLTGSHGLVLSADAQEEQGGSPNKEEQLGSKDNYLEAAVNRVKLHFNGDSLRELAQQAIQEGEPVSLDEGEMSYSRDAELLDQYRGIFSKDKEVYEIPLDEAIDGISNLSIENGGKIRAFVELDPVEQRGNLEKSGLDQVALFSKDSSFTTLLSGVKPEWFTDSIHFSEENHKKTNEESQKKNEVNNTTTVGAGEEQVASPSELSTFEESQASEEDSTLGGVTSEETSTQETEEKENVIPGKPDFISDVFSRKNYQIRGTELIYFLYENAGEEDLTYQLLVDKNSYPKVKVKSQNKMANQILQEVKSFGLGQDESRKTLYQEMKENLDLYAPELRTVQVQEYSLNELGRNSQNKEVEGFGTVEVFYEKEAFSEEVQLEVQKLRKPNDVETEEENNTEVLKEKEVQALKNRGIYDNSLSLDIHFVNKEGVEVEPLLPVSVRLYISKDILPEEVDQKNIAIHHLVEEKDSGNIAYIETVSDTKGSKLDTEEKQEGKENKAEKEKKQKQSDTDSEEIIREFKVNSFSVFTINWGEGESANFLAWFYYLDGDYQEIGPRRVIDLSQYPENFSFWISKDCELNAYYHKEDIVTGYPNIPGYKRHTMVYPGEAPLNRNDREKVQWKDPMMYLSSRYTISQYQYNRFGYNSVRQKSEWNNYDGTCYKYYYFFYQLDPAPRTHNYQEKQADMRQEKFITKNTDGSYDLSLTAEAIAENKEKTPLDVIFVYDRSYFMAFPYNYSNNDLKKPDDSLYKPNDSNSRHTKGREIINTLVDQLSKNPYYDTHFALSTMGGNREVTYEKKQDGNIKVTTDKWGVKHRTITDVKDEPWNDGGMVYGFTGDSTEFKKKVNEITLETTDHTGLNYGAGLSGVKDFQDKKTEGSGTVAIRSNSKRIVVMLTAHDPTYSYIEPNEFPIKDAQGRQRYEMEAYIGGAFGLNFEKYRSIYPLGDGWSYGGGRVYQEHAMTYARGKLAQLGDIDAFYSIGLGPSNNWNHLRLLTSQGPKWFIAGHPKEQPLGTGVEKELIDASDINKIPEIIKGLRQKIQKVRINTFEIWDQLSENVEPNFDPDNSTDRAAKLRWEVWKTDDDGKPIAGGKIADPKSLPEFQGLKDAQIEYDKNNHIVKLKADTTDDFSMPKNYQFRLVINVKPTIKAYEKYQKNFMDYFDKETERQIKAAGGDIGYLDNVNGSNISGTRTPDSSYTLKRGDIRTDQWYLYQKTPEETFHTSSQKDGFYSNEGAYLSYVRYKNNNTKEDSPKKKYQKPVVQIEPATLRIVKSFVGTTSSTEELELLKNISFILKEQIPGSTNYREVKRFTMTKSATSSALGYLVSEELNGTKLSGTGKNLTPENPTGAGTLQATMQGGKKQYVLSINGLIPGRKYQVEESISASGQNPVIGGSQLHFKKMAITAGVDRDSIATSGNYEIATVSMGKNETKQINVQNTYEREDRQVLRIEKQVSGEMADKNQVFPFRLKLFKAENQPITQSDFDSIKADFPAATKSAISFDPGTATISFSLKHDQAIEFLLPKTYYYMAGENPSGYLPSVSTGYILEQATDAQGFRFTKKKLLGRNADGSKQVLQFRNVKDPISPTGVVEEARPLAMVFTAFILFSGAIAFGMKKKEEA